MSGIRVFPSRIGGPVNARNILLQTGFGVIFALPYASPRRYSMQKNDRAFAQHWEELVALASNESDSQKLFLLRQEILQLLEERESKAKRKAVAG